MLNMTFVLLFFRCIVYGFAFYYGLLLPVCLILLGNWIVLSLNGMRRSKILRNSRRKREQENTQWVHLKRAAVCTTILGLTWTFGALAVGYFTVAFQWLFCILNTLQGLLIFLLFVVLNEEVKKEIYAWAKGKTQNADSSSNVENSNESF